MDTGAGTKQESAILELSENLIKSIGAMQAQLEDSFKRNPPPADSKAECSPQTPNVLDEINQNLQLALVRVQKTHEFVVREVIHKVHNV